MQYFECLVNNNVGKLFIISLNWFSHFCESRSMNCNVNRVTSGNSYQNNEKIANQVLWGIKWMG